ncbi:MAG: hypothetical protein ACYTXI_33720 [Nostoc sp.]
MTNARTVLHQRIHQMRHGLVSEGKQLLNKLQIIFRHSHESRLQLRSSLQHLVLRALG